MLPLVALVGRPNVGKSRLFNRIVGRRLAIVEDTPGVTRDRQYAEADHAGRRFRVVDTGGFTLKAEEQLVRAVREQADAAIREADVLVLVVDAEQGLAGADRELAALLRKGGKPVLLAANKVDSTRRAEALDLGELHSLGFDVFPLSAEHGRGVSELLDAAVEELPPRSEEEDAQPEEGPEARPGGPVRLAVVGRPNVGKSTLLNRLLGEERFVAAAMPGTTRDAVEESTRHGGRTFVLVDTAGLRKKRQVTDKVEVFSAQRALRAVERADAVILAVNKWDLVRDKEGEAKRLREEAARHLQHVGYAPLVFVSALEGTRVQRILDLAAELHDQAATRLKTPELNDWVQRTQDEHPAPLWRGYPVRFSYAVQVGVRPISIAIQCNRPQAVDEAYRRFLVNRFRERFQLHVPVRLVLRQKSRSTPRGRGERA